LGGEVRQEQEERVGRGGRRARKTWRGRGRRGQVIELRFHRDLYRGESVDAAAKALAPYASAIERSEEPAHLGLRVTAAHPERERRVAGEIGNRALGLTVRRAA